MKVMNKMNGSWIIKFRNKDIMSKNRENHRIKSKNKEKKKQILTEQLMLLKEMLSRKLNLKKNSVKS